MGQDATASPEASEQPETGATPETAATNDMAVAFAALGADGLLELPAEAPANDELPQNGEERQANDLAELNAQLAEPVAERAKAEKAIAKYAALEERAKPWWRRLVEWIGGHFSTPIDNGSTPVAAGQPGSACRKGCRGEHDRRRITPVAGDSQREGTWLRGALAHPNGFWSWLPPKEDSCSKQLQFQP
jgi:hypothetical protein